MRPQPVDPHLEVFDSATFAAYLGVDIEKARAIIKTLPHRPGLPLRVSRSVARLYASGVTPEQLTEASRDPAFMAAQLRRGS